MKSRRDIAEVGGRTLTSPAGDEGPGTSCAPAGKKWLGIFFRCCHSYGRLYRNDAHRCYEGACPRCHAPLRVAIGEGGTTRRFFEAS